MCRETNKREASIAKFRFSLPGLTAQQKVGGASPIQQSLGLEDHESQIVNFVRFA